MIGFGLRISTIRGLFPAILAWVFSGNTLVSYPSVGTAWSFDGNVLTSFPE